LASSNPVVGEDGAAASPARAGRFEPARLLVGRTPLRVEDVVALARGGLDVALDDDPPYRAHLEAGRRLLDERIARGEPVYGVTTGVGASVGTEIPPDQQDDLPLHLLRFHGCGTGRLLDEEEAAAVVAVRLASLVRGWSAVRPLLLERLCDLLNLRLLPRIPAEGSVGASGDLTPLSYLAAALVGEREVTLRGEPMDARAALRAAGLEPLRLARKESLAIMNGTSVMTALGCLAFERALRLARLACALTAMASDSVRGNRGHFDPRLFAAKPHPGQSLAGAWIWRDLEGAAPSAAVPARLQDRYSIRCAPHVVGVLLDSLRFAREILEIEVNSANDNPLVDPATGDVLHGGNFYGGHVCFVLDGLKTAVANVADLLDRQLLILCCPETNGGLPENLVHAREDRPDHHGFKAMQISTSALAAEALKLTVPASAFSRSTESHNQDKVSMGTIAARDCLRVLELSETVAAILVLAVCQAVDLRNGDSRLARSRSMHDAVRKTVPMLQADRRQDIDIQRVLDLYRSGGLPFGDPHEAA
jgi:histidine ammonia-lyase